MWKRISRKRVISTPFLNVYKDAVQLPNGTKIDDFTVVAKKDIVLVVAMTQDNKLVAIREYKYAVNQTLLTLPAGQIDDREDPLTAAKRELAEETGYDGGHFTLIDTMYEYPSKDSHKVYIVSATNVAPRKNIKHEATEQIELELIPIHNIPGMIANGQWKITSVVSALVRSGIAVKE